MRDSRRTDSGIGLWLSILATLVVARVFVWWVNNATPNIVEVVENISL